MSSKCIPDNCETTKNSNNCTVSKVGCACGTAIGEEG